MVRPDVSLGQLTPGAPSRLVLVPGSRQCTAVLLADPRVHQLLEATLEAEGYVAALAPQPPSGRVSQPAGDSSTRFLAQGETPIADFVEQLVTLTAI